MPRLSQDRPRPHRVAALATLVAVLVLALVVPTDRPVAARGIDHPGPVLQRPADDVPGVRGGAGDAEVRALAEVGRWVVVGGSFETATAHGTTVARPRLVAYDRRTGELHPTFAPRLDGRVRALAADGTDHVVVGGEFLTVDGVAQPRLARFDLRDGTLDASFRPRVDAFVNTIVVARGRVVVGGAFTSVDGQPRLRLAALSRVDGTLDPGFRFDVTEAHGREVEVRDLALTPDERHLLVVHTGRVVAAQPRVGAAVVTLDAVPVLRGWRVRQYEVSCEPDRGDDGFPWLRAGDIAPDGSWAVVMSGNGNFPPACDTASRFPLTDLDDSDVQPTWVSALFDTPESVAISDEAVYVGGHFTSVMGPGTTYEDYPTGNNVKNPAGALDRFQLAALSVSNGTALADWRANADGRRGVLDLLVTPHGLLAGSDGTRWAQQDVGAHAFFPAVPRDAPSRTPARGGLGGRSPWGR